MKVDYLDLCRRSGGSLTWSSGLFLIYTWDVTGVWPYSVVLSNYPLLVVSNSLLGRYFLTREPKGSKSVSVSSMVSPFFKLLMHWLLYGDDLLAISYFKMTCAISASLFASLVSALSWNSLMVYLRTSFLNSESTLYEVLDPSFN